MDYDDMPDHCHHYTSDNPHMFLYPWDDCVRGNHGTEFSDFEDSWDVFNEQQLAAALSLSLSAINLMLAPRVESRDVSVQVNPRKDASVQCSIGPKTLATMKLELLRRRKKEPQSSGFLVGGIRYPLTLAVYSPMANRNVISYLPADNGEVGTDDPLSTSWDSENKCENSGGETVESPTDESKESRAEEKKSWKKTRSRARVDFQFLEQKYGYYHCKDCNIKWESAFVWCIAGTNKVYYKQNCRECQKNLNPYSVEDIKCSVCKKPHCLCKRPQRNINPKRPHRQELCGRCRGRVLSCDSTFSFKYIV